MFSDGLQFYANLSRSDLVLDADHPLDFLRTHDSEAWGPPQFQEKRSRSEKAILGALGAFRGILGATLGIRNSILGIQNSILGMASHDLSNTKTTILGATPGAVPGIDGNLHERFSFAPPILGAFFRELGWSPRARMILKPNFKQILGNLKGT